MYVNNIGNLKFNIKQNLASLKKENVTSSISNANNFDLYDRALSNYNQINFMARPSYISKEELQEYISKHPEQKQKEIAEHFKVSTTCISQSIKKYDIAYQTKMQSSISEKELRTYIKQHPDKNQAEIALHFNSTISIVSYYIQKYKIEYHPHYKGHKVSKEELQNYIIEHPKIKRAELAQHFNLSQSTINYLLNTYKIEYRKNRKSSSISEAELIEYTNKHPEASLRKLAEYFDTSVRIIDALIKKLGIEHRSNISSISKEILQKYIFEHPDKNQAEIAEHFKVSPSVISKNIRNLEIEYTTPYKSCVSEEELRSYINTHYKNTLRRIGEHFHISPTTIHCLLKKYGIEYETCYKNSIQDEIFDE